MQDVKSSDHPEENLFSLVADCVGRKVRQADERNELLVPDWRDTILAVYERLQAKADLPNNRDALLRLIEREAGAEIARETAGFRSHYEDQLRTAPDPPQDVLALLGEGKDFAAVDLYRRYSGLGFLAARDAVTSYAEEHSIPIPPAWQSRKRFPPVTGEPDSSSGLAAD